MERPLEDVHTLLSATSSPAYQARPITMNHKDANEAELVPKSRNHFVSRTASVISFPIRLVSLRNFKGSPLHPAVSPGYVHDVREQRCISIILPDLYTRRESFYPFLRY